MIAPNINRPLIAVYTAPQARPLPPVVLGGQGRRPGELVGACWPIEVVALSLAMAVGMLRLMRRMDRMKPKARS